MMNSEAEPVRDWKAEYSKGTAAWDTGRVSSRLQEFLESPSLPAGARVLDIGCGAETNAIFLAKTGFEVTAVDITPEALELAAERAAEAGIDVQWTLADVLNLTGTAPSGVAFDFVFDRGCFHLFPPADRPRFLEHLLAVTRPGSVYLMLCGNAREPREDGPPVVSEKELRETFEDDFEISTLEEFHLHTMAEGPGPLAFACDMRRKPQR